VCSNSTKLLFPAGEIGIFDRVGPASLPSERAGGAIACPQEWGENNPPEADECSRTRPCESRDDALMVDRGLLFCLDAPGQQSLSLYSR
jgi:hypothetical protein